MRVSHRMSVIVVAAAATLLTACASSPESSDLPLDEVAGEDQDTNGDQVSGDVLPAIEDLPSCDTLRSLLELDHLVYEPDYRGDEPFEDGTRYGIACTWFTPDSFEKQDAYEAFADPGEALGITIEVLREPEDEAFLRSQGWAADDPRLEEYGGWLNATLMDGEYDPDAAVSFSSPTVNIGRFTSYIMAGNGLLIAEQNQLLELTDGWAVEQAINIYEAIAG